MSEPNPMAGAPIRFDGDFAGEIRRLDCAPVPAAATPETSRSLPSIRQGSLFVQQTIFKSGFE
jgi:hypothetical protein